MTTLLLRLLKNRHAIFATLATCVFMFPPAVVGAEISSQEDSVGLPPDWTDPAGSRLPSLDALASLRARIGTERWGGKFIERSPDPALRDTYAKQHVLIVNATAADEALARSLTSSNPHLVVDSARYSLAQLSEWKDLFSSYLRSARLESGAIDDDEQHNRVSLHVDELPPGLEEFAAARGIPDEAWTVAGPAPVGVKKMHTERYHGEPYEGGLEQHMFDSGGNFTGDCTTSFVGVTTTGSYKAVGAGHCEAATSDTAKIGWGHGTELNLGDGALNSYVGATTTRSDAVRYTLPSGTHTRRVLLAQSIHANIADRYYASQGEPQVNTPVCSLGSTSGGGAAMCDYVTWADFTMFIDIEETHLWRYNAVTQGGDSGGPVYRTNADGTKKIAGAITAGDATHSYFHHVSYILADLDLTLYVG